jgi:hypothetical protein
MKDAGGQGPTSLWYTAGSMVGAVMGRRRGREEGRPAGSGDGANRCYETLASRVIWLDSRS